MRTRTTATGVAVATVAALTASIAVASIPDGVGNIHACYKQDTGVARVVDTGAGDTCKAPSEVAVQWNVIPPTGSPGPQGPQGPAGPQGTQGLQGARGANAVTYDHKTMTVSALVAANSQVGGFSTSLTCPQGTKALVGSWYWFVFSGTKPPPMGESYPIADDEWGFATEAGNQSIGSIALVKLHCAIAR